MAAELQPDWHYCVACAVLAYGGFGESPCYYVGNSHGLVNDPHFYMRMGDAGPGWSGGWQWCNRCYSLAFTGFGNGICTDGAPHNFEGSAAYCVRIGDPALPFLPGTKGPFYWCKRCQCLIHFGRGVCSGMTSDGLYQYHDIDESIKYCIPVTRSLLPALFPDLIDERQEILRAIDAKAGEIMNERGFAAVGEPIGELTSCSSPTPDVWTYSQRFDNCTVFHSKSRGTRALTGIYHHKFWRVDGNRTLGYPMADELTCPDGQGRCYHFESRGAIYQHPQTGTFALYGAIWDEWGRRDWEAGPLGYPTIDQFSPDGGEQCCAFQSGALSSDGARVSDAPLARLDPDPFLALVWEMFDRMVHQVPDNVGLHPHRSIDAVSDTSADYLRSSNRITTVTINGFRDNGLAPDTDWSAQLGLRISPHPHPGGGWDLQAGLHGVHVDTNGLGSETISRKLVEAISSAFATPVRVAAPSDPTQATIPDGVGFIDVKTYTDGGLGFLFCDTASGRLAAILTQRAIEALLE